MADATLSILINAKNNASGALKEVQADATGLGGSLGKLGTIVAGVGLERIGEKAGAFLADAAQAAADDAASMAKLKQAVDNSGASWADYKGQLDDVIESGMKKGFTDDQSRDALSLLVAQTGSASEAMKRYTMAQDLARGANIDVVTASKLLGKVTEDNVNVLGRYGINVKQGASETELFGAIQQKFGGQADAFANSTAGQMASAKIQMSELKEQIGYAVLPALALLASVLAEKVAPAVASVIGFLVEHKEEVLAFGAGIAVTLVPAFIAWAVSAGAAAAATLLALAPIIAVGLAVGLLGLGIYELVVHWDEVKAKTIEVATAMWAIIDEKFHAIALIVQFVFEDIKAQVTLAFNVVRDIFTIAMAVIHGDWGAAWNGIKQLLSDVWDGIVEIVSLRLGFLRDLFVTGMGAIWDAVQYVGAAILGWFEGLGERIINAIGNIDLWQIGVDIVQSLIDGLESMVGSVEDFFGGLTDMIPDWKGPADRDATLLYNSGQLIIGGLQAGMEERSGGLFAFLADLTNRIKAAAAEASAAYNTNPSPGGQSSGSGGQGGSGSGNDEGGHINRNPGRKVDGYTRDGWLFILRSAGSPEDQIQSRLYDMFGYERGTLRVPRTGMAMLHKDEGVIPASMMEALRALLTKGGGGDTHYHYYIGEQHIDGTSSAGLAALGMA